MDIVQERKSGKILELFQNEAQKNAYYFEVLCHKDIDKMRKARIEIDKRIEQLAEAEIKQYQAKALAAEKALVYALDKKTTGLSDELI